MLLCFISYQTVHVRVWTVGWTKQVTLRLNLQFWGLVVDISHFFVRFFEKIQITINDINNQYHQHNFNNIFFSFLQYKASVFF